MVRDLLSNKIFLCGLIGCLILTIGGTVIVMFKTENSIQYENSKEIPIMQIPKVDDSSEITTTDPWSKWILKQAEVSAKNFAKVSSGEITYNDAYKEIVAKLTEQLEELKKQYSTPPPLDYSMPKPLEYSSTRNKRYTGPQTVEALMEEFHSSYGRRTRRFDDRYPPEQWLQMLLNKGVHIENRKEYSAYMTIRGELISSENDVETREFVASSFGIANDNLEVFKSAYIDSAIAEVQRLLQDLNTDPNVRGGITIGDSKNFLPFYHDRNITYVIRRATGTTFMGTTLTQEQKFNLVFRGIEPKEINIVYVDREGNRLEDKPPPITRKEVQNMMTESENPLPKEWWDKDSPIPDPEDFEKFLTPENTDNELDYLKNRTSEKSERQPEFEQFMREVVQLEKFATMSDAEIAAELEKQLRHQLLPELPPEESLDDAIREKIIPKEHTPDRFHKAMHILQNHGPKEGLRKLVKNDPALAEYLRRNSQKLPPKRTKSSSYPDSQNE